jgi:hypothetical protein
VSDKWPTAPIPSGAPGLPPAAFAPARSGISYTFQTMWLRPTRSGSAITAYTSADGATGTKVGTATMTLTITASDTGGIWEATG